MKFDDGMKAEREIFTNLMFTPECVSLRHLFIAERAASKIPGRSGRHQGTRHQKVGVIGASTMGGGIAMNFLNASVPVVVLEMKQEAIDKGFGVIRKNYEAQVAKEEAQAGKLDERMGLLSSTLDYADLKDCDLIIEAVFEEIGVRKSVQALDA